MKGPKGWMFNGYPLPHNVKTEGTLGFSIKIKKIKMSNQGIYTCSALDESGENFIQAHGTLIVQG